MPYPSKIDQELIVSTAVELIERDGGDALSLGKLAKGLGVRTPSLYRYFDGRAALLQAVNLSTLQRLFAQFDRVLVSAPAEPVERLMVVAETLRGFAHRHPNLYVQAMTAEPTVTRPDEDLLVQMVLPMQAIMAEVAGEEASLTALRGFLALVHGFTMLELHEQLQRGGNLDDAFADSVSAFLAGWHS